MSCLSPICHRSLRDTQYCTLAGQPTSFTRIRWKTLPDIATAKTLYNDSLCDKYTNTTWWTLRETGRS